MNTPQKQEDQRPPFSDEQLAPSRPIEPTLPLDEEQQAEYLAAFQLQLKRMSCPGCGEGEDNF